ncbi:MAG TPA: hypothetical protein VG329_00590 [Candidatus Dormibacteraeota bacterium]|jgi:hypothetical protein|nr:hypothetical protein [Candidatus Dormibacteraeota bacterium]
MDYIKRITTLVDRVTGRPAWSSAPVGLGLLALLVAWAGFYWDVAWHIDLGRDIELFTPPHLMILAGLAGIAGAASLSVALATVQRAASGWRLGRIHIPYAAPAFLICGFGALSAFPLDDLWHRAYGVDVTMWSPTHLMMIGGAILSIPVMWMLRAEGSRASTRPPSRTARRLDRIETVTMAMTLLLGLSAFQLEFDLGVPQWQALYQPVLIALAASVALVASRVVLGRGGALLITVAFLGARALMSGLVALGLGRSLIHFPLYLGMAVLVELSFWAAARWHRPAWFAAVASGALIGTVGLATEWGWSHVFGLQPWHATLFPGIWSATVMALAGAILGLAFGRLLRGEPVNLPSWSIVAAVAAVPLLLLVPLPRHGIDATADIRTAPVGDPRMVVSHQGTPGVEQYVSLDVTVSPDTAADSTDWFRAVSWQGNGMHLTNMRKVGPGRWQADAPVPTGGGWKTLVVLDSRDTRAAVPVYFPADEAYGNAEIAALPQRTAAFRPESSLLMREAHDGAAGPARYAFAGFIGMAAAWTLTVLLGAYMLARRPVMGPRRPVPPRQQSLASVTVT